MKNNSITHFIFDMDGLLLDTEPFYTQAAQKIVGEFGKTFDWDLKAKTMGRPAIVSAQLIVDTLSVPITAEEYLERREKIMNDIFPKALPKEGAKELTMTLFRLGIPIAVATSSSKKIFSLKIQKHKEWFSSFNVIVNGDDPEVKKGKPAPDIFLLAAKRLSAEPSRCLVFEDSPTGVQAGVAAGMKTVAVCEPNMDKNLFKSADQMFNSLSEFSLSDWGIKG